VTSTSFEETSTKTKVFSSPMKYLHSFFVILLYKDIVVLSHFIMIDVSISNFNDSRECSINFTY
jgi:hypothetical protein